MTFYVSLFFKNREAMSIKSNVQKAILTGLIAFSAFSFIYVNSQYETCPFTSGDSITFIDESINKDVEETDNDFMTLPDLSMIEKGVKLLQRLTRH